MPYLVDGHNLIPHIPGLSLQDPDDEARLLAWLQSFGAKTRRRITVYFDRRAPGTAGELRHGPVTAHFVSSPGTADDAIRKHLLRLNRQAHNWTVVSSDGEVRRSAERSGAHWLSAQAFAERLAAITTDAQQEPPARPLTPDEVAEWEAAFSRRKPASGGGP
jgi:predicted RNA-binding protein with PIN domain